MTEKIFIGVAWPYANGDLHVGRVSGALLPPDVFARYHRLKGNDVLAVSGSDAHGTPITIAADKEGISPKVLFERNHQRFLQTQQALGISYSLFTHTHTQNHQKVAQDIFCRLHQQGYIFPQRQKLLYSESERRFLPDRYVIGSCPECGSEARGDQCEQCGTILNGIELINPRSVLDGSTPVVRETTHLFLDLPAFADQLLAHLDRVGDHWRAEPRSFTRSFIEQGLKPRPITRDLDWGIPVPLDGWDGKKLYIWFENVIGYLSASIEWAKLRGKPEAWKQWWYAPEAKSFYFLGKDNIPFHTIIWPAELLGIGRLYEPDKSKRLNLPYDVPASAFLGLEGRKFSTSRGWAVWLSDLLERYDVDAIRFYLLASLPETKDSDFSWAEFVQRNNAELVGTWGNLVNRVLRFAHKHWNGRIPQPGALSPIDVALRQTIEAGFERVSDLIEAVKLRAALTETLNLARAVNGYLEQAPWFRVIKTDKAAAATTVYTALWAIDSLKLLFAPFLPHSSEKLHWLLGYQTSLFGELTIREVGLENDVHEVLWYEEPPAPPRFGVSALLPDQPLLQPEPLFRKLETAVVAEEQARLNGVTN